MMQPIDLGNLTQNDADICLSIASIMNQRDSRAKEDQLIITALRFLAHTIRQKPA
jgi:hypothetical protein